MLIRNLRGLYTGKGFVERDGRRPCADDCGFVAGPVDLAIDDATGTISPQAAREVIDGSELVALPGFIDPHTHAIFAGQRSGEYFMRWGGKSYVEIAQAGGGIHSTVRATAAADDDQLRDTLGKRLRDMVRCGATTVEVKSGYGASAVQEIRLLRIIRSLSAERGLPRVRVSFLALHAVPKGRDEKDYVDEMIAALATIAQEKLADHVDTFPETGFFTLDNCLRFSRAAQATGLPCKVHADELCDLGSSADFIEIGALSIDHLQHINDRAVQLLATKSTVATMLPATSFFVGIPYANARKLIDGGARVALATDFNPGTAPALDLQLTHMLAASQMRMTAAEILCASTFNAAAALGLDRTHGALLPGRSADILLYRDATLEEIVIGRHRPVRVIAQGRTAFPPTHT